MNTLINDIFTETQSVTPPPVMSGDFAEVETIDTTDRQKIDRTKTRWLFFAGNLLESNFTRHYDRMSMGGEHLGQNYKTLRHSKGILRRCQLTPMVEAYDWNNSDALGDNAADLVRQPQPLNQPLGLRDTGFNPLYGIRVYPGDEIEGIIQIQQAAGDTGVREVEILRGMTVADFEQSGIQRELFPSWDLYLAGEKQMPATVASLENYLTGRRGETGNPALREIIDVALESCAQYRRWGTAYLDRMGRLVKAAPTTGGQTYSWTPVAVMLFDQLELNREEFLMKKSAPTEQSDNTGKMMEMFLEMQKTSLEMQKTMNSVLSGQKPSIIETEAKSSFSKGDFVAFGDEMVEIIGKPFGRYKIRLADNSEETVNADQLSAIEETPEAAAAE